MSGKIDCYGVSHIGQKRASNQDQFLIADLTKSMRIHRTSLGLDHQTRLFSSSQGKLLLVADGMGGHEAGERASTLTVDSVANYVLNKMHWVLGSDDVELNAFQEDLKSAPGHCNEIIAHEVSAIPQREGMGTTLTMAYVVWPKAYVVHVGDSRCYVYRDGIVRQVTHDHTMADILSDHEQDQEALRRWSHVLWNVIGGNCDEVKPECASLDLELGDGLLLCTDGLTRHVDDATLADEIGSGDCAKDVCERLQIKANQAGGSDNITIVLAKFLARQDECEEEVAEEEVSMPETDTAVLVD